MKTIRIETDTLESGNKDIYVKCPVCGNGESHPEDEQIWHLQNFTDVTRNDDDSVTMTCACCGEIFRGIYSEPKEYTSVITLCASVTHKCEDGSDITPAMIRAAYQHRLKTVDDSELKEAVDIDDTQPVYEDATK